MTSLARNLFGYTPADFAVQVDPTTRALTAVPGATGQVFSTQGGAEQLTDLLDAGSSPVTVVAADSSGRVAFYGPPGVAEAWVDFGSGRFRMIAVGGKPSDPAVAVWTPSDPTGVVDMTAELEAFRAANLGKTVRVASGSTIKLSNAFAAVTTGDILLDLTDCVVLYPNTAGAIKCDNTSRASAEVTVSSLSMVTVNTDAYVTQLTLAATLAAAKFDWLAFYSATPNPAIAGGQLGEIVQVLNNEASLNVALTRRLNRYSQYTTTLRVRKLDASRKVRITGGTFRAAGNTEDTTITTRSVAIQIFGYVDPRVENVAFDHPWAQCLWFQCCAAPKARNITVSDVGNLAASNGFTYGVMLYGMNDGADLRGLVVRNGRHPAVTTDGNSSSTNTWYAKGIPTNAVIDGVHGSNCHGALIDTHEEGDNVTFLNVVSHHAYQDADISGSFTGTGAQLRCSNVLVRGFTVVGGTRGIKIPAVDHGFEDRVVLDDIRIQHTTHATDGDVGVQIDDQSALANKRHVVIKGDFDNVGTAISAGKKSKVTLPLVTFRRCKIGVDAAAGSDVVVPRTSEWDYRGATRTTPYQPVVARSDSANGGCSVVFLQPPVLIKGTATTPTTFITEADTTAPKKVWVPELIVLDQTASGVPSVVPATQTTFDVADVFRVAGFYTDTDPGQPGQPGNPSATYPQQLLTELSTFKLTLPTGTAGSPDEIFQPALATYSNASWFRLTTAKDGVEYIANCGGTTTGGSSFARTEDREMTGSGGTAEAAWNASDGNTHTMTVTQSVDQLPINRPLVVCGQVHGADTRSYLLIVADGFRPTSGTAAVTGTSTQPYTLMCKINDASSAQVAYVPILTGYVSGQTFTLRLEAVGGVVNVYCDLGTTATTLRYSDSTYVPTGAQCYFKAGCYLQANTTNGQTVPHGSAAGGADLTSPAAGSTIAGDASSTIGKVTHRALDVNHTSAPVGTATWPADLLGQNWKITLQDGSEVKQPAFATFSDSTFHLNTTKDASLFSARCGGGTTPNSTYPRTELRERLSGGTVDAAWSSSSGTHTFTYTTTVDELPVKKPEVVVGQIHTDDAGIGDTIEILASGFYPNSGTVAVVGTDTSIGFDLRFRFKGSSTGMPVLIPNLHLGEKFTVKIQCTGDRYRIWADKGTSVTGIERTSTVTLTYAYAVNYFKLGVYVQSNTSNGAGTKSAKKVPKGTCAGGADLTSPVADSLTGGDASTAGGTVTVYGTPVVTHA